MVRYLTAVFSALLIGWSVIPSAAQAQTVCGERKAIVASLEKTFSEAPVSMGLGSNGVIIEVFASPFRTFTIILTRPDGVTCVVATGENWEDLPKRLAGAEV